MKTLPFSVIGGETTRGGNGLGVKQLGVKNTGETTRAEMTWVEMSWGQNVLLPLSLDHACLNFCDTIKSCEKMTSPR